MYPEIKILINNYISDNYYVKDNALYQMFTGRLVLPLILEDELLKVFGFNIDDNEYITYCWLHFNGMKQVRKYWESFPDNAVNELIDRFGNRF